MNVLPLLLVALIFSGCACPGRVERSFQFPADGFAYANELRWHYRFDPSGKVTTEQAETAPGYSLHCFPMVRAAREFFYHARFKPGAPRVSRAAYQQLARKVIARNSRCPAGEGDRIVIPGFANLHELSAAYPDLLKRACGGAWRSFFQRGNWRMVLPLTHSSEAGTARRFLKELESGRLPIAHIYTFPNTKLNHGILIYEASARPDGTLFRAYDPNNPGHPAELRFQAATRAFLFERNQYFAGGPVKVYEVYRGWAY